MQITRNSLATVAGPSDWFTGDVYIEPSPPPPAHRRSPLHSCASRPVPAELGVGVIRVDRVRPAASGVARRPGRQRQRRRDGCEQEHADADTEAGAGGQVEGVV